MNAPRSKRAEVNGWVVLDKPVGMTSTHAVARLKRLFNAKKAGHAGTLDPLASGVLPVAFGEATKTVPFVQDGEKAYRFTIQWGAETDSDDADGQIVARSDLRPEINAILAALPHFTGTILQTPPAYSAIKINGERAYDIARDGEAPELSPRPVTIHELIMTEFGADDATFDARCGKGTYVRAIARDLGRALGCCGHVSALRRTQVGPFSEKNAISLDDLTELRHKAAAGEGNLAGELLPVATALDDIPALAVSRADAGRLRRGQSVLLRGRDAPLLQGRISVTSEGALVALAEAEGAEIRPTRIFNLSR
jgi:tRNA pseudouridine55 synthase